MATGTAGGTGSVWERDALKESTFISHMRSRPKANFIKMLICVHVHFLVFYLSLRKRICFLRGKQQKPHQTGSKNAHVHSAAYSYIVIKNCCLMQKWLKGWCKRFENGPTAALHKIFTVVVKCGTCKDLAQLDEHWYLKGVSNACSGDVSPEYPFDSCKGTRKP